LDTRHRILTAATGLFMSAGYSPVSMEQVARESGVGKATLYRYFPSKEALMISVAQTVTEQVAAETEAVLGDAGLSPRRKAEGIIAPVLRIVARVNPAALADIRRAVPEAYALIDRNRRTLIQRNIAQVVREGQASGAMRGDVSGELVAHLLIGALSHLSVPEVLIELGVPPEQLLNKVLSVVWEGCLSERGRGAQ
jgi:AcrR family transcriptional regulator